MDTIGQELRQAARRLLHSPAFTATTVLTLALAIGANAAIFAVVERVVINPLPYPQSDRLIELDHGSVSLKVAAGLGNTSGLYFIYRNRAQSIESAALYAPVARTLIGAGDPERLRVVSATPSLGAVLRVRPALGRWFTEAEGMPGGPSVGVLSDALWSRRFGRDASVIGRSIVLDGTPVEIVGVMPADFGFPDPATEIWIAARFSVAQGFGSFGGSGIARLRDGVSLETARAELQGLLAGIADAYPEDPAARANLNTKLTFTGRLFKEATLGNITRDALDSARRRRRRPAGGLREHRQSVPGAIRVATTRSGDPPGTRSRAPRSGALFLRGERVARRSGRRARIADRMGCVAPAGPGRAANPATTARGRARSDLHRICGVGLPGRRRRVWIHPAVASSVAVGASRIRTRQHGQPASPSRAARAAWRAGGHGAGAAGGGGPDGSQLPEPERPRSGFRPDSTLTFSLGLPPSKYRTIDAIVTAHQSIIDRVAAQPGVTAVSATTCLPLSMGCNGNTLLVEGEVYPPGTLPPLSLFRAVGGGYFETMGMRILRGRGIERGDVDRKEPVAVISRALATNAFKDADPIGRRIASNQLPAPDGTRRLEWLTVVGVVSDTPTRALTEPSPMPMTFIPMSVANGSDMTRDPPKRRADAFRRPRAGHAALDRAGDPPQCPIG